MNLNISERLELVDFVKKFLNMVDNQNYYRSYYKVKRVKVIR